MDDMQRLAEAVSKPMGIMTPAEKARKEVALLEAGDVAVHFPRRGGVSSASGKLIEARGLAQQGVTCSMSQQSYRFHHFELLKT